MSYVYKTKTAYPSKSFYCEALRLFAEIPPLSTPHIRIHNFDKVKGRLVSVYEQGYEFKPQSGFFTHVPEPIFCIEELQEKLEELLQQQKLTPMSFRERVFADSKKGLLNDTIKFNLVKNPLWKGTGLFKH